MLAVGFIDLRGATLKTIKPENSYYSFSILTPTRIWYLRAENEEDCKYWINGIKKLQQLYNNKRTNSRSSKIKELELQRGKVFYLIHNLD